MGVECRAPVSSGAIWRPLALTLGVRDLLRTFKQRGNMREPRCWGLNCMSWWGTIFEISWLLSSTICLYSYFLMFGQYQYWHSLPSLLKNRVCVIFLCAYVPQPMGAWLWENTACAYNAMFWFWRDSCAVKVQGEQEGSVVAVMPSPLASATFSW